jgi:hypothetical protein
MDYKTDIRIDETALDVEWLEQATLAMKYGKYYAMARKNLLAIEEKLKVLRAELIALANSNPVKYCKKDKPNAADIEAFYRNHPRHQEAKAEWIEAQYELDMAEIAKNEISFTRKVALENLVRLHGQQYFAGPKVPRDLAWERKEKQKAANAVVANKIGRTK